MAIRAVEKSVSSKASGRRPAGAARKVVLAAWLMAGLCLAACAPAAGTQPATAALTPPVPQPQPNLPVPTDTELAATESVATEPVASPPAAATEAATAIGAVTPMGTQTPNGCPEQQAPGDAGAPPAVVLGGGGGPHNGTPSVPLGAPGAVGGSATLAVGQVLEVRLQPGMLWTQPPPDAAGVLAPADPNGWFAPQLPACVWRFTAHAPGTVTLAFDGRPICPRGFMCPQFIVQARFDVTVQSS